ncbi:12831_t:CDS:2 [Dentiscutata erythropus]|uniref:protein S-acyltransferase n=1 Tax=Dentiscutata erythropus TaxID=1348616 RepID=A0A9N9AMG1_9GLOM|nr:12831_t:CDS:2 [Dentiscutata erythropus]
MAPTKTQDTELERHVDGKNLSGIANVPGLNIAAAKTTVAVTNVLPKVDNHAAQQGNLHIAKNLIEQGRVKATDRDSQNATPLHWAAINNHVIMAKYLIDNGAEVDALGGELDATPLHWAARSGHLSMVTLLVNHGADPNIRDSQGFNGLHIATHSSTTMLVLYLLYHDMDIDTPDVLQHTPLMWAAYQGDASTVDLLIRLGASLSKTDAAQFTPLHWAMIKGNQLCIRKLIEAGANINAKEENGKTPSDIAREMKADRIWERALHESGIRGDRKMRIYMFNKWTTLIVIYFLPFLLLFGVFNTLVHYPWFIGLPMSILEFVVCYVLIVKFLIRTQIPDALLRTPYFTSLFQASAFWVGFTWIYKLLFVTSYLLVPNVIFVTSFVLSMYWFYTALFVNPGFIQKKCSREEQKQLIMDLANQGMLDSKHLCITCLSLSVDTQLYWSEESPRIYDFTTSTPEYIPIPSNPCFLNDTLCGIFQYDMWTASIAIWLGLHLIWIIGLICMQFYQIAKAKTTNEMANFHRYSYFGNRASINVREQIMATLVAGPGAAGTAQAGDNGDDDMDEIDESVDDSRDRRNRRHSNLDSQNSLMLFSGRESMTSRRKHHLNGHANENPFDFGCWNNCVDFWSQGQAGMMQKVDWYELYDVPLERYGNLKPRSGYVAIREDDTV